MTVLFVCEETKKLITREDLLLKWAIFQKGFLQEIEKVMESESLEKVPGLQEVLEELKSSAIFSGILIFNNPTK